MTMLERLVAATLKRKGLVAVGLLLVVGLGIYSLSTLPIDAFPDVTNVQVEVVSTAAKLSPLEIEKFVTAPIEIAMRGLPGLVQMRSLTKFGIAVVTLIFEDGMDIYFVRQQVFQRLVEAEKKMPQGVETEMGPVATAMGEIYHYTLEGKEPADPAEIPAYLTELRSTQDWLLAPLLKNIKGVSEVNSFGGYVKQFQVNVDPRRLLQYGLTLFDVFAAVGRSNENMGGGVIARHGEQYVVRGIGLIRSLEDIRRIVLKAVVGFPITVADVASVTAGQALRQGAALKNGKKEVVGGVVMMLKGENSREVVRRVQEKVAEINSSRVLPKGMIIKPYYERSEIIESSIGTVAKALAEGALLVFIILFLFLRNLRGALVVVLALPLSLLLTFTVMKQAGLDANLMSLGGLAITLGMIIDATIIQVENVQRLLSHADPQTPRKKLILQAVLEVRKPSIFGELIIALTFIPIIALQGYEGKMFSPLAFTVAIALLASLLLSLLVIPVLCLVFLKPGAPEENPLLRGINKAYRPALHWTLKHPLLVAAAAFLMLAGALALVPRLGTEFIPIMDEGAFDMDVQQLPGISLDESLKINGQIQNKLMQFPELDSLIGRTGQSGIALEAKGVEKTGYTGTLKPRTAWRPGMDKARLIEEMRRSLETIPGIAFGFSQPIQCRIDELVAGTRALVIVKVYGPDLDMLKRKAEEIAAVLVKLRGCTDLMVEQVAGQPYVSVRIDRERIARFGLNVADVLQVVEIGIGGKAATQVYEENRFFDLVVRFREGDRDQVEKISNILIRGPQGQLVPLSQLAGIGIEEGPLQISREDGQRRIGIELNIRDRDIGSFVAEARKKIKRQVSLPAGYFLGWGGQFENQQRAQKRLLVIAPLVVALILFLLFLTFSSLPLALLVLLNLPLALIGGIFALYLSGLYLSVPASIGFIVLFGVAVLNGVVLVSCIAQLRTDGVPLSQAISDGCRLRLRPVLMTASISIFSLIPMIFATGPGSEIQRPLAVVVVGGLLTSTLMTLLVLPAIYHWFESRKKVERE
jgi:cobalt-zinc-cadmium resistance protein CzcA